MAESVNEQDESKKILLLSILLRFGVAHDFLVMICFCCCCYSVVVITDVIRPKLFFAPSSEPKKKSNSQVKIKS